MIVTNFRPTIVLLRDNRVKTDYETWMEAVDEAVWSKAGCSVYDLSDCCFADWFDRGVSPKCAAAKAIRASGGEI